MFTLYSKFYSSQQIDTYNRLYNFIVGERGVGKTFHLTEKCIKLGLKFKRPSFVWVRRLIKHIDNIKKKWWMDVENKFPKWSFFNVGNDIYARNKEDGETFVIGEYMALSDYINFKSTPHPYCKIIVFDEFLAESGTKYLNNEINTFFSICDSVIRLKDDVKVYLLGNAVSMINPYFVHFNVKGNELNNNFIKGKDYVIENCDYKEFREMRKHSKFGQSIEGTKYGTYAIDNKFLLDNLDDVCDIPKGNKEMLYNLRLHGHLIAVYMINGFIYFDKGNDTSYSTFSCYPSDAKIYSCQYMTKQSNRMRWLTKAFLDGMHLYRNLTIKNEILDMVTIVYKNFSREDI